jgi:hypothetical protein
MSWAVRNRRIARSAENMHQQETDGLLCRLVNDFTVILVDSFMGSIRYRKNEVIDSKRARVIPNPVQEIDH